MISTDTMFYQPHDDFHGIAPVMPEVHPPFMFGGPESNLLSMLSSEINFNDQQFNEFLATSSFFTRAEADLSPFEPFIGSPASSTSLEYLELQSSFPAVASSLPPTPTFAFDNNGNCYSVFQSGSSGSSPSTPEHDCEPVRKNKRKACTSSDDDSEPRNRPIRPKVIEGKGSVQCVGTNRKRGTQCRNAALMEYIGPRPSYCAEHIELDPESLYEKCNSAYQKEPGDGKGCKEVVLKEFGICYKHFHDLSNDLIRRRDMNRAAHISHRIVELHRQLEGEALAAKRKDGDLYQRKNKLLPKFQEMRKMAFKTVETLNYLKACGENTDVPYVTDSV